jgi:hypothetical protein
MERASQGVRQSGYAVTFDRTIAAPPASTHKHRADLGPAAVDLRAERPASVSSDSSFTPLSQVGVWS